MSIFRGLLSQLVTQDRSQVAYFYDKTLAKGKLTLTSPATAQSLLELFCETSSKKYVIIDGLDKCSPGERKLVLSVFNTMLHKYVMKEPGKLRVLFVSQDEEDIKGALNTATWVSLGPGDIENVFKSLPGSGLIELVKNSSSTSKRLAGSQSPLAKELKVCFCLQNW